MNRKPRIFDGFCGEGGAGMGYHLAGFDVVGGDIKPQPRYPFTFIQGDSIKFIKEHGHEFDAIHTSPVCKRYTACSVLNDIKHPDQIPSVREALIAAGKPYIIENVRGAPLIGPIWLCGCMFGLRTYRLRGFEINGFSTPRMFCRKHTAPLAKMGRPVQPGEFMHIAGHYSDVALARKIMRMPWGSRDGISQAVPVVYTEYVGRHLMAALKECAT
jgi:DNA (cytosine-5)-methyltransferase 1